MFISKSNTTLIDALLDAFAYLMRVTSINHIQLGPAVLTLGTRRGTHKEIEFQFALKTILFNMVGKSKGDHLGISNTCKTRPAKISFEEMSMHNFICRINTYCPFLKNLRVSSAFMTLFKS
jgi:hypothetical protein